MTEATGSELFLSRWARSPLGACALAVWRHRIFVFGTLIVGVVATLLVTMQMPKMYESTASLLAPKEGSGTNLLNNLAISGILTQAPGLGVASLSVNRDMFLSILKSRTVAEAVVEQFGLLERYRSRSVLAAVRDLQGATTIAVSREGVIAITVEDHDPRLASEIANFYVAQLDRLVSRYGTGEAGRQRAFFTEQLGRAKRELEISEEALRRFQERNRAVVLQEQTRGAVEAAARLKGEITASEVQLQVMRSFATEANSEVIVLRRRVDEMKRQLTQMQYGERAFVLPSDASASAPDFSVPFAKMPGVGLELIRLTRDVKVQETVVTILTQQLEQARITEARDLPTVQVLDRAVPPDRHSRPRLKVWLMVATVVSLAFGISVAVLLEQFSLLSAHR